MTTTPTTTDCIPIGHHAEPLSPNLATSPLANPRMGCSNQAASALLRSRSPTAFKPPPNHASTRVTAQPLSPLPPARPAPLLRSLSLLCLSSALPISLLSPPLSPSSVPPPLSSTPDLVSSPHWSQTPVFIEGRCGRSIHTTVHTLIRACT